MKHRTKIAALLLASASVLGVSQARADDGVMVIGLKVADASTSPSTSEVLSVTAADQPANAGGGGTATANVGTIDVQGAGEALGSGYIVPEDGPKERSTVTHAGIENILPTSNPFQAINLLPGVNQFQDDALGLSGGTLRVRGLTAAELGFTVNGVPVNDSGNFAIYPQEYIDTENLAQIWVTQGSTDNDAPHVGAAGGNIGIVTRAPLDYFNVQADQMAGQLSALREFVSVDTGWIGDFKGFVSFSHVYVDKWRGAGDDDRYHTDGNLQWQFLPHSSINVIWSYNDAYDYEYAGYSDSIVEGLTSEQTLKKYGPKYDYDTFWGSSNAPIYLYGPNSSASCTTNHSPTCTVPDYDFSAYGNTSVGNTYAGNLNPFRDGILSVPLHLELTDDLRWETTGYLWWGYGGGGFDTTLTAGNFNNGWTVPTEYGAVAGDSELFYRSSVTRTFRPGVESKFIYDMDNYTFSLGTWLEHSVERQTAPYSLVNSNATPCDGWLLNTNSNNLCVVNATYAGGISPMNYRDINTVSTAESFYGEATGRFFDDSLKVTVGISDRDSHRSMYDYLPDCAVNATYCGVNGNFTLATAASSNTFTHSVAYTYFGGTPGMTLAQEEAVYQNMEAFAANPHANFNKIQPEFNATYDIDPFNQLFADEMQGIHAPSNYSFSTFNSTSNPEVLELPDIKPEVDTALEVGYRFHGDFLTASTTVWLSDVQDYQATAYLPNDPVDKTTVNIGGVKIFGIDAEAGTKPWNGFTFYASGELEKSQLADNVAAGSCTTTAGCGTGLPYGTTYYLPTKGKQLVDTPEWIVAGSIGYENEGFFASLSPKCQGERATSLMNDEYIPAFCQVDASIGYNFDYAVGALKGAKLQLYVTNLFDERQLGEITTTANTNSFAEKSLQGPTVSQSSYTAYPIAPTFIGVRFTMNLGH